MSKVAIKLRIPYPETADAGDALQVYTDFGSGTVDTTKPLLASPLPLFPGKIKRSDGFGTGIMGLHRLDGRLPPMKHTSFGQTTFGVTPMGQVPPYVDVVVYLSPAFGKFKFAVEIVDAEGNKQIAAMPVIERMVAATDPPPLESFAYGSYDGMADTFTFNFTRNTG